MSTANEVVKDAMEGNSNAAQPLNCRDIDNPALDAYLAQTKEQALECARMQELEHTKESVTPQNEQKVTLANNTPEIPSGPSSTGFS